MLLGSPTLSEPSTLLPLLDRVLLFGTYWHFFTEHVMSCCVWYLKLVITFMSHPISLSMDTFLYSHLTRSISLFSCGDQITEVNDTNLSDKSITEVRKLFHGLTPGEVRLKLIRPKDTAATDKSSGIQKQHSMPDR